MANETQRKAFLSYSRINKDFAVKLAKELKSEGFHIWVDQLDIPPGARWDAEVEKALEESEIFMVIITPASAKSENVLDEIGYAIDSGKHILPVLLETATLPLRLRRFQYVDFTSKSFDEGVESARELLRTLITQPTIPHGEVLVETQAQAEAEREATPLIAVPVRMKAKSVSTTPSQKKPLARELVIGLIAAVVLGIAGIGYVALSKGGSSNPSADSPVTIPATETSVDSPATNPVTETSVVITPTSIQPSPTFAPSATAVSAITSNPSQADASGQAVFIQSALSGDMRGDAGVRIEHDLASKSDSLVFITPNYQGPDSPGVYNDYPTSVFFYGSQWIILNLKQDENMMATMPFRAAFNVQILKPDPDANVFIHTSTSSDPSQYWTAIDSQIYPLAKDPNALVFATYNFSASEGRGQLNNHPIGVWYKGTEWVIFNRDLLPMPKGTAFNVQIVSPGTNNAIIHMAMPSNIRDKNGTAIDNPNPLFRDPNLLVFAMPRISAGSTPVKNDINIGVYHNGTEWTIFNQDRTAPMPEGAEFNILILERR